MTTIGSTNSEVVPRFKTFGVLRYILYGVNVVLLVSTITIMEWQRRSQESVADQMDLYHLMTVTRAAAFLEEVHVVEAALDQASDIATSADTANEQPFLVAYPDAAASLFLAESLLAELVETQEVFRNPDFRELVPRIDQQFFDLKTIASGDLYQQSTSKTALKRLKALALSLNQLKGLHSFKRSKLAEALPV